MVYTIKVYVDGGCRGNGTPRSIGAAAACLIRKSGKTRVYTRNLPARDMDGNSPTNQSAEITAIGNAFVLINQEANGLTGRVNVEIFSDSRYAIGCMTEWAYRWKSNGWKNSAGAPIANQKLIKHVLGLQDAFSEFGHVRYTWIPRSENQMADRYCNQTLDKQEEDRREKEAAAQRARKEAEETRPSVRTHSCRVVPSGHANSPRDEKVSFDFFMSSW